MILINLTISSEELFLIVIFKVFRYSFFPNFLPILGVRMKNGSELLIRFTNGRLQLFIESPLEAPERDRYKLSLDHYIRKYI